MILSLVDTHVQLDIIYQEVHVTEIIQHKPIIIVMVGGHYLEALVHHRIMPSVLPIIHVQTVEH